MKMRYQIKPSLLRGIALVAFLLFMSALIIRSFKDYNHSKERGRFVLSILKQDHKELVDALSTIRKPPSSNDDPVKFQSWLVKQLLGKSPPPFHQVALRLAELEVEKTEMAISLHRWNYGLTRWAGAEARSPSEVIAHEALRQGRLLYYEATGYLKIGRELDATTLYLGSFALLSDYIEASPTSPDVPEALFLLGVSKLRLSKALPSGIRSTRLLNLCVELYPDSIWAKLSRETAREGAVNYAQGAAERQNDI